MFPHCHLSSSLRPCLRSFSRPLASTSNPAYRRGIVSSRPLKSEGTPAPTPAETEANDSFEDEMLAQPDSDNSANPTSYRDFMEKIGHKFQYAEPLTYLGNTPFPMNPSFKPPPPISNEQKEVMFRLYLAHRLENGPRRLAKRFNISLKRVQAILRLKLLERSFEKQNRKLQTGFQVGMERLLGATTHSSVSAIKQNMIATEKWLNQALNVPEDLYLKGVSDPSDPTHPSFESPEVDELRSDVQKADMLEQEEQRDASASHYERLYWESVQEDGREPLLPSILQTEKQKAEMRKLNAEIKASKQFLVRKPQTLFIRRPKKAMFVVGHPRGRQGPVTKFLDVGGEFMDLDDRIKSMNVSRRRSSIRGKKSEAKRARFIIKS